MGQCNAATIANYLGAQEQLRAMGYSGPPPSSYERLEQNVELSAARMIDRIDSLRRINEIRERGGYWQEAFDAHLKEYTEPPEDWRYVPLHARVSPPPPPRKRPRPPQGSKPTPPGPPPPPRIQQHPTFTVEM
jgi:hypothetical protein